MKILEAEYRTAAHWAHPIRHAIESNPRFAKRDEAWSKGPLSDRAFAIETRLTYLPRIIMFLDDNLKELNEELRRIWRETGTTILFVTHSIYEAAFLGQRVLMLASNPGRVREIIPMRLPEERSLAIRETAEFVELAAYLRRVLES